MVADGGSRHDQGNGQKEDNGRMAEREEESEPERPLALLQQIARRVIDGRDMVGIEPVAKTEKVRGEPKTDECRKACRIVEIQRAPTDMQQPDQAVEKRQAPPLRAGEPETGACITGGEMIAVR